MSLENRSEHFDVVIVGAGVSGLGAACHLQRECPGKSFVILESRGAIGGTWDLFRYPGIRCDSDFYTYSYDFKIWDGPPIASGPEILKYLHDVAEENELEPKIRFRHRVNRASWRSEEAVWTVEASGEDGELRHFTANFLFMCPGYYSQKGGYRPEFPDEEKFRGPIVHPQHWPEDLDYTGKRMVVIGSGATAATIVPAAAGRAAHVTQLQRSPTYYISLDNSGEDPMIKELRALDVPKEWIHGIKQRRMLAFGKQLTERALSEPEVVKKELIDAAAALLPEGYDVETHFTPAYGPWKERLCLLPDGDFLRAVGSGKASVVTGEIERFVENGILLKSGEVVEADIIVTATGLELCALGNVAIEVDGREVIVPDAVTYKGVMLSEIPNLAWTFGYIRSSWTLRADMIAHFICRLLNHMDKTGMRQCTPRLRTQDRGMKRKAFVDPDDFAPGYMRRGAPRLPKQGDRGPWVNIQNYYVEKDTLPGAGFDDGVLVFDNPRPKDRGRAA